MWMVSRPGAIRPTSSVTGRRRRRRGTGLFEEIETLAGQGVTVDASRLKLSDRAHLLFDLHKEIDGLREGELAGKQIGTTKRGIGPAYASKVPAASAPPFGLLLIYVA